MITIFARKAVPFVTLNFFRITFSIKFATITATPRIIKAEIAYGIYSITECPIFVRTSSFRVFSASTMKKIITIARTTFATSRESENFSSTFVPLEAKIPCVVLSRPIDFRICSISIKTNLAINRPMKIIATAIAILGKNTITWSSILIAGFEIASIFSAFKDAITTGTKIKT